MDLYELILGAFSTGGVSSSRSSILTVGIILLLIQLEINLLSNFMAFIATSEDYDDLVGEICGLYILVIGACETAIGLSLLVSYYRIASNLRVLL
jgi:NADH:ubiquinone oxidoreductase subunit K